MLQRSMLYGLGIVALVHANNVSEPVIVGAIRWDAYFGTPGTPAFDDPNFGIVTRTTTYDLSPNKWHYRVPFFGKEVNATSIEANGNTPEVMGQELAYAQEHGIQVVKLTVPRATRGYRI